MTDHLQTSVLLSQSPSPVAHRKKPRILQTPVALTLPEPYEPGWERFQDVFEGAAYPMLVCDSETRRFLAVNRAAIVRYGYSREELLERSLADLRPGTRPTHHVAKDGTVFHVEVATSELSFGGRKAQLLIVVDHTERARQEQDRTRARVEAELRSATRVTEAEKARARHEFISQASLQLLGTLDSARLLERLARIALPNLADYCVVDLLSKDGGFHSVVAHADPAKEPFLVELRKHFGMEKNPTDPTWRVLKSRRSRLIPEVTPDMPATVAQDPVFLRLLKALDPKSYMIVPIIANGRMWGSMHLARTSPSRRFNESDLELAEELGRRAAYAVENAKLYEDARHAVKRREEFISVASHELKTPIQSHRLQTQLVRRILKVEARGNPALEKVEKLMEMSEESITRMCQLVNSLLDVSRITADKLSLDPQQFDLATLAPELLRRLSVETLVSIDAPAPVFGRWDKLRVEQILTNLITNAIKYGCGRPVVLRLAGDAASARIEVQDQGLGIAKDAQARIFDRFERATSEQSAASLGLGLYIVRSLVRAHGGAVWVESELGKGSTFHVELPLQIPERST